MKICDGDSKDEYEHPELEGGDVVTLVKSKAGFHIGDYYMAVHIRGLMRLVNLSNGCLWERDSLFGNTTEQFKKVNACLTVE